jgi:FMN-dependent NADH-azoreductase
VSNILVLNSSLSGDDSVSRVLVAEIVKRLVAADPRPTVTEHDLGVRPVPHLTQETVAGVRAEPRTAAEREARAVSDKLIGELKAADILVIGAPMHNFNVPTVLRSWFDYVLRAGATFGYSDAGPKGLLSGKRAILALARGGFYSEGPTMSLDFQEPYLRQLLGFIGITDVHAVYAEKIGFGPDARAAAILAARERIAELVEAGLEPA